ncbi:MAG TPA: methyltransferase domain-containing protein [Ilumatobacteraceae bacterium]|nr:methyltransferase domain-containing protein [Ilumatobacteraceae bacterium]
MSDDWDDIAEWWVAATGDGPADSDEMLSVLRALIDHTDGRTLDLGCGDGQALPLLGDDVIGVDLSRRLLLRALAHAPVVRCRLPDLSWVRRGSIDRAVAVGVLELLPDAREFFDQLHTAVRAGGTSIVVMNHPVVTAEGSEPLVDEAGEVVWRWGRYLERGSLLQPAGRRSVELHHRPLGELLTTAADAGWRLEHLVESGATTNTVATESEPRGQQHLPSILGARWRRD